MSDYLTYLDRMSRKYGVPPEEARAIYELETRSGRVVRQSPAGAIGHMQLMPATARELGVDPNDPYQNIEGGVRYYAQQRKRFNDPALAAAAYNAGPTRVARLGRVPNIPETRNYVTNFLKNIGRVRPSQPAPVSATTPQQAAPQGQMTMDETEDTAEMGGLSMFNQPVSAEEFSAYQAAERDYQRRAAQTRADMFKAAQANIEQATRGPSSSQVLGALAQSLLAPRPYAGFAGTMANLSQGLNEVLGQRRTAERARAEALARLRQSYATGELEAEGGALDRQLKMLQARIAAGKGGTSDFAATPEGVIFSKRTGYPRPSAAHVTALLQNPDQARDFNIKFGPGAAEEALRTFGAR